MSYKARISNLLEDGFINCRQRYMKEFDLIYSDGTSCQGAPIIDPGYQEPEDPVGDIPREPNYVSAVSQHRAVLVTWDPPRSNGGLPLTGYEISYRYRVPGSGYIRVSLGSTSNHRYLIETLTNGTEYTVEVRAMNAVGRSQPSVASTTPQRDAPVTTPPGPVTNLRVERGQQSITIRWDPPANDGKSPITTYHIVGGEEPDPRDDEDPAWRLMNLPGTSTSATFRVYNDETNIFEVTPRNATGIGSAQYVKAQRAPIDKQITLEVGADATSHPNCTDKTTGCFRINATLGDGFGSGPWEVKCATKDLPRSRTNNADPTNHEVWKIYTTSSNPTSNCIFGTKGETVYVIVDGIRSDELYWDVEKIDTGPVTS